jgi:hypothetical protein
MNQAPGLLTIKKWSKKLFSTLLIVSGFLDLRFKFQQDMKFGI